MCNLKYNLHYKILNKFHNPIQFYKRFLVSMLIILMNLLVKEQSFPY